MNKPPLKKADIPVTKSVSVSVPSISSAVIGHMPKRRPPRLNVDYTREVLSQKECSTCHVLFRDPLIYQFHTPCFDRTPFHLKNGYKCPSCPDSTIVYGSLISLREHGACHRVPPLSCSYCHTRTQHPFEMELHLISEHTDKFVDIK